MLTRTDHPLLMLARLIWSLRHASIDYSQGFSLWMSFLESWGYSLSVLFSSVLVLSCIYSKEMNMYDTVKSSQEKACHSYRLPFVPA